MDTSGSATKADIALVRTDVLELTKSIKKMHKDLREADDQILTVLINVDKRLTGRVDDHERRIVVLEGHPA